MIIHSSYGMRIKGVNLCLVPTLEMYRRAVDFLIDVALAHRTEIPSDSKEARTFMERLTIKTRKRPSVPYDFSHHFYKFPSYLRRSAIAAALGAVRSWSTRYANWESSGKKGTEPGSPKAGFSFPVLYRKGCFEWKNTYTARIKVFIRNTWDWMDIRLDKSDVDYVIRHCSQREEQCPMLVRKGRKWFLNFSYEESVRLPALPLTHTAVGVDLGVDHACVCSAMNSDGTVSARGFLNLAEEEDCLMKALGQIKNAQRHGSRKMPRLWKYANGRNRDIAHRTAKYIVDFAVAHNASVIVFEHLAFKGKRYGSRAQRLHLWKKMEVQRIVTDRAHRLGIHIHHVNPRGTSALAFDGSGPIVRDEHNYSVCTFTSGKQYDADLSASYNIGARYFIRELQKSISERIKKNLLPEGVWHDMEAKVPSCSSGVTRTLSTLINLRAAMDSLSVSC